MKYSIWGDQWFPLNIPHFTYPFIGYVKFLFNTIQTQKAAPSASADGNGLFNSKGKASGIPLGKS